MFEAIYYLPILASLVVALLAFLQAVRRRRRAWVFWGILMGTIIGGAVTYVIEDPAVVADPLKLIAIALALLLHTAPVALATRLVARVSPLVATAAASFVPAVLFYFYPFTGLALVCGIAGDCL